MITVVVADDHPLVREGVRALLATAPDVVVVGEAGDGSTALKLIEEHHPDVALVDISMPGMSGVDLTQAIVNGDTATAVLILSMHNDSTVIAEALAAGARGYLLKESGAEELLQAIRDVTTGDRRVLGEGVSESFQGDEDQLSSLTAREREIVTLVAAGMTSREIGERLGISIRTVEAHRANAARKLGSQNSAELVLYAVQRGLLRPR